MEEREWGSPEPPREKVKRVSISLQESVFRQLDEVVEERGYQSRSQAISEMVSAQMAERSGEHGKKVMAGTLTLLYNLARGNVRQELARLQQRNISEVISSLHVLLEGNHVMEVMLLQGPADKLESISDDFITLKGVSTGKLTLVSQIMPPIHSTEL